MNPDGTSDTNLQSYYGPQDNGKGITEMGTIGDPTQAYTAARKFTSQVSGITAVYDLVIGGTENVVDINNGANDLSLTADRWDISRTKYGFTIKGGAHDIILNGTLRGHGKQCDVDIGNWSDQDHDMVGGTHLNLKPEKEGDAVIVRYVGAYKPSFAPMSGPYKFVFPWPWIPLPRIWIARIFNQLRRWNVPGTR